MLPAIPVVLKTAATSIAKQAAVDAASGALSSASKKKLSKVTGNNSDKQKFEREYSKNFQDLEEVDTSNNVMSIQDSFNSKLDSIVSTDPESSNLIKAVKDSNKATAELVSESLKEVNADVSTLAGNLEAVNANIESVGQMSTLAAETSAMGVGSSSNFISDVADAVKNVIQTLLGGALLSITGMFQSISRMINKTQSEEGGDKTGVSGLEIVGDEDTKELKAKVDKAYADFKAAERLNVSNSNAYATQFRDEASTVNSKALISAFESPEKALEKYNKNKPYSEKIKISDNSEENFINLVKANRNLKSGDKGYIPFNETILKASDEELKTYYSEYEMVDSSNSIEARKRKEDYESKKADFKKVTEESRQLNSEKIREKVIELLSFNNKPGEAVIKELMTDKDGNEIKDQFADVVSYYSTDKGMKRNKYNLSDETLNLYKELIPKLVEGLQNYITSDSLSETSEGRVTNDSPDNVYLKYVVGLGGDVRNLPLIGTTQNEDVVKEASSLIFNNSAKLINREGKDDAESLGMSDYETYNDVVMRGVNKYDDILIAPVEGYNPTEEEKSIFARYNGFSYDELMVKLGEIKKAVEDTAAAGIFATLETSKNIREDVNNLDAPRGINVINQPTEMD